MNKKIILMGAMSLALAFTSCSKDDDNKTKEYTTDEAQNLDYTSENAAAWGNYAANVAKLLQEDSNTLYSKWYGTNGNDGYGAAFKKHDGSSTPYTSAESCIEEILLYCSNIANEVGTAKIGEPYNLAKAGKDTEALYAVESWYSWHSRDDYKNNILSIARSLLGRRISVSPAQYHYRDSLSQGTMELNSILVKCMTNDDLRPLSITVWQATCNAWAAIDSIPQPFRSHIYCTEAAAAMNACATLSDALLNLRTAIANVKIEWQPTIDTYVDKVVLPTYKDLKEQNIALYNSVYNFQKSPSNDAFEACTKQWLKARAPWETSEAFLFGPVSELGLDPNMDSWPLQVVNIANLLQSQNWAAMNWSGTYEEMDEDDEDASSDQAKAIAAAQELRGYHTLEFLLFKDGQPRTVK